MLVTEGHVGLHRIIQLQLLQHYWSGRRLGLLCIEWFALETKIVLSFLRLHPSTAFLSTMTHLSWVALHGMAHSFIELDKAVVHMMRLVNFL